MILLQVPLQLLYYTTINTVVAHDKVSTPRSECGNMLDAGGPFGTHGVALSI